jgi:hypothetical protein
VKQEIREELQMDVPDRTFETRSHLYNAFQMVDGFTLDEWMSSVNSLVDFLIETL